MPHPMQPPPPSNRQLPLPLTPPELRALGPPPARAATVAPCPVWPTLSSAVQVRLRHTMLRILPEVVHDAGQR